MTYTLNEFLGGSYNNLQIKEEVNLLVKILLFRITREKFGGINFFGFEEIGLFWLNYRKRVFFFLIHLFARDILLMKNLEIEETKTTEYSTFKTDIIKVGLVFFDIQLFH